MINEQLPEGQMTGFEGIVQLLEILRQMKDMLNDMTHKTAPNNNFYGNINNLNLYQFQRPSLSCTILSQ